MSTRKTKDILLGGQPKANNAPPGAPAETRFLGRGESVSAETINRGVYAVAGELDKAFSDFLRLARKAVTKGDQKGFTVPFPTNVFSQEEDDATPINAYVGTDPANTPSQFMEILQPGSTAQYQENLEGSFTVFQISAGSPVFDAQGSAVVAFQLRSLSDYTGLATIAFIRIAGAGPALAAAVILATDDIDITVTYYTDNTDTFADAVTAINGLGASVTTRVDVIGSTAVVKDHDAVNPSDNASSYAVPLQGKGSADAAVEAILIDDPLTGDDIPTPNRFLAKFDGTDLELLTDDGGGVEADGFEEGDYILVTAHPTTAGFIATLPSGYHAVYKVESVVGSGGPPAKAYLATHTISLEQDFDILTRIGYADVPAELLAEEQVYFTISRYEPRFWAVGHEHAYDLKKTGVVNPLPFEFAGHDNVHWFQGTNGVPHLDYATDENDLLRVADFKSILADTGAITQPDQVLSTTINKENPASGLALTGLTEVLQLLVRPRFAGANIATPRLSLEDMRFVFSATIPVDPSGARATIRRSASSDPTSAFEAADVDVLTAKFEQTGATVDGKFVYRLDPFTVLDAAAAPALLFSGNDNFFYLVEIDPVSVSTALLSRTYFQGAFAGSAALRFSSPIALSPGESREFSFNDVEVWVTHEGGEPVGGLVGTTLDLQSSTTGLKGSYVDLAMGLSLELSHKVSSGPFGEIYAYRAQAFSEGYDLSVTPEAQEVYVAAHVQQAGNADTHRRVTNIYLVESQVNAGDQIGAYVGDALTGVSINPAALVDVEIESAVEHTSSDGLTGQILTDTGVTDFTVEASVGDWLVIIDAAANAGNHRISAVAAQALTLATPDASLTDIGTDIIYKLVQGGAPEFPAGVEGGTLGFQFLTGVDLAGLAGFFDLGVGSYARFQDLPPDGLRSGAGSFGDTSFLTAKIAEIMGTGISETVPLERNLVNLDLRIKELSIVTVGLGTLTPLSFGKFNVNSYGSVNETVEAAIASLPPGGGVIAFKPGLYGDRSDNNGSVLTQNRWSDNLYIEADNVTLRAESPGTVTLLLDKDVTFGGAPAPTESVNIILVNPRCSVEDLDIDSTTTANTPGVYPFAENLSFDGTVLEGSIWLGGPDSLAAVADSTDQMVRRCRFYNQAYVALGYPGAGDTRLEAAVTRPVLDGLDFLNSSCPVSVYANVLAADATALQSYGIESLYMENIQATPGPVATGGASIALSSVQGAILRNLKSEFYMSHCELVAIRGGTLSRPRIDNSRLVFLTVDRYLDGLTLQSFHTTNTDWRLEKVVVAGGTVVIDSTSSEVPVLVKGLITGNLDAVDVLISDVFVEIDGSDPTAYAQHALELDGPVKRALVNNLKTSGVLSIKAHSGDHDEHIFTNVYSRGLAGVGPQAEAVVSLDSCRNCHVENFFANTGTGGEAYITADLMLSLTGASYGLTVRNARALGRAGNIILGDGTAITEVDLDSVFLNGGDVTNTNAIGELSARNLNTNDPTTRAAVRAKDGQTYIADGKNANAVLLTFNDGDEVQKFGANAANTSTFRVWSHGDRTYLSNNVAVFTAEDETDSGSPSRDNATLRIVDVLPEDSSKSSFVMAIGSIGSGGPGASTTSDSTMMLFASGAGGTGGGSEAALKQLASFRGRLGQIETRGFQDRSFMGIDADYLEFLKPTDATGTKALLKVFQFEDGVVLGQELALETDSDSWRTASWNKTTGVVATAMVLQTRNASHATANSVVLCSIAAVVSSPFLLGDHVVMDLGEGSVRMTKRVEASAGTHTPATGLASERAVVFTGSSRFQGNTYAAPGLILAPGRAANDSIMHDFSDLLGNIQRRIGGGLDVYVGAATASLGSDGVRNVTEGERSGVFPNTTGSTPDASNSLRLEYEETFNLPVDRGYTGLLRLGIKFDTGNIADLQAIDRIECSIEWDGGVAAPAAVVSELDVTAEVPEDGDRYFLLLPPVDPAVGATGVKKLIVEVFFSTSVTASLNVRRLHLYHSEATVTGRLSPSWADLSPQLTIFTNPANPLEFVQLGSGSSADITLQQDADKGIFFRDQAGARESLILRSNGAVPGLFLANSASGGSLSFEDSGKILHRYVGYSSSAVPSVARKILLANTNTSGTVTRSFTVPPNAGPMDLVLVGGGGGGGSGAGGMAATYYDGADLFPAKVATGGGAGGGAGAGGTVRMSIYPRAGTTITLVAGKGSKAQAGGAGTEINDIGGGAVVGNYGETGLDGGQSSASWRDSKTNISRSAIASGGGRGSRGQAASIFGLASGGVGGGGGGGGVGGAGMTYGGGFNGVVGGAGAVGGPDEGLGSTARAYGGAGGKGGYVAYPAGQASGGGKGSNGGGNGGVGAGGAFPGHGGGGGGGGGGYVTSGNSENAGAGGSSGQGGGGVVILTWADLAAS